jgi:hypothetical protein
VTVVICNRSTPCISLRPFLSIRRFLFVPAKMMFGLSRHRCHVSVLNAGSYFQRFFYVGIYVYSVVMQSASTPPSHCSLNVSVAIPSPTGFHLYLPGTFSIFGNEVGLHIHSATETTPGSKRTFPRHELRTETFNALVHIRHAHTAMK